MIRFLSLEKEKKSKRKFPIPFSRATKYFSSYMCIHTVRNCSIDCCGFQKKYEEFTKVKKKIFLFVSMIKLHPTILIHFSNMVLCCCAISFTRKIVFKLHFHSFVFHFSVCFNIKVEMVREIIYFFFLLKSQKGHTYRSNFLFIEELF